MSVQLESTERFFRPTDVENIRRNYRGMQMRSLLRGARHAAVIVAVLVLLIIAYRRTQSDARFAIRNIEVTGGVHTPRAAVDALAHRYVGTNLFRLDINRVRRDISALEWVNRVEIEKALPGTVRIRLVERTPAALIVRDGVLRYVDENGVAFAALSPVAGDNDLPLIVASTPADTARCVAFLRRLRTADVPVYGRVAEVRALAPHGFAMFDRELGATVYVEEEELSTKYRQLHAIVAAEHFRRGDLQYADLRFDNRIVVKPIHAVLGPSLAVPRAEPTQITN